MTTLTTCGTCGETGESSYKDECRACYSRRWRQENPEKYRASSDRQVAKQTPETRFAFILKHRYNITPDQYFEMLDRQGGLCAVCLEPPRAGRRLSVDHDHDCCPGKGRSCGECIRGLLCQNCNALLGMAAERIDILRSAIEYLEGM